MTKVYALMAIDNSITDAPNSVVLEIFSSHKKASELWAYCYAAMELYEEKLLPLEKDEEAHKQYAEWQKDYPFKVGPYGAASDFEIVAYEVI